MCRVSRRAATWYTVSRTYVFTFLICLRALLKQMVYRLAYIDMTLLAQRVMLIDMTKVYDWYWNYSGTH